MGAWGSADPSRKPPKLARDVHSKPGLFPGDCIVEVDGRRFGTSRELLSALQTAQARGGSCKIGYNPRPRRFIVDIVPQKGMATKFGMSVLLDRQLPDWLAIRVVRSTGRIQE